MGNSIGYDEVGFETTYEILIPLHCLACDSIGIGCHGAYNFIV